MGEPQFGTKSKEAIQARPVKLQLLWSIFWTLFKIGPVTFGGGYAMVPVIEHEFVERKKWFQPEEIAEIFGVAGTAPGSIAVNSGTYIGYRLAGIPGAIAGVLGSVLPTFLIVLAFAMVFYRYKHNPVVQSAFMGIRPAVVALILYASYKIGKTIFVDKLDKRDKAYLMTILCLTILLLFLNVNPIFAILVGAFMGMIRPFVLKKNHPGRG